MAPLAETHTMPWKKDILKTKFHKIQGSRATQIIVGMVMINPIWDMNRRDFGNKEDR